MKTALISTIALSLILTGCGQSQSTPPNAARLQQNAAGLQKDAAKSQQVQHVYVTVEPGIKLGSDGKKHDAFINGDFKVTAGKPVELKIYNYDDMPHSMTAPKLGLNVQAKGTKKSGTANVTTVTFTPKNPGTYDWQCVDPCDLDNGQWSMSHTGYMMGQITVLPADNKTQYISLVVNGDYKLGSDGKKHDAFTPSDFTVHAGEPVKLTVYNFDDMQHSVTAPGLNLDLAVTGSEKEGEPSISTAIFTPTKAGDYDWRCEIPCDTDNGQWSMSHEGYMMGHITVK